MNNEKVIDSLYLEAMEHGLVAGHHGTDLYLRATPEAKALMEKYGKKGDLFKSLIEGDGMLYEVVFAYEPPWIKEHLRGARMRNYRLLTAAMEAMDHDIQRQGSSMSVEERAGIERALSLALPPVPQLAEKPSIQALVVIEGVSLTHNSVVIDRQYFDVTNAVLDRTLAEIHKLVDDQSDRDTCSRVLAEERFNLKDFDFGPVIRVEAEEAICRYFGTTRLSRITQDMLEAKRVEAGMTESSDDSLIPSTSQSVGIQPK